MLRVVRLFQTSIGSKQVLAATGVILVLFLLGHMLGNLTIYQGPEAINAYGAWLQGHPFLWVFRLVMLAVVTIHIAVGVRLYYENRRARPQRYARHGSVQLSPTARTMIFTGLLVLAFLLYHLAHLTGGIVGPQLQRMADGHLNIYANVVSGFNNPWIAGGYVLAMLLLGFHLNHAIRSLFQTFGVYHENWEAFLHYLSPVLSAVIVLGFISVPIAVQLGVLTLPSGGSP
jgi:succinate dehydrogenase / fumarate reductase cytochrome b subunit